MADKSRDFFPSRALNMLRLAFNTCSLRFNPLKTSQLVYNDSYNVGN
uniref:Uncharacterized protein n=1 Tax=Picea sitchensis TaxID=3332 RepID=A0A6B9XU22_PICSI|nr:hypothetical protein Q903MT_gene5628 [Picea sitchensis]